MPDALGFSNNNLVSKNAHASHSGGDAVFPIRLNGETGKLALNPMSLFIDAQEEIGGFLSGSGKINKKDWEHPNSVLDNRLATITLAQNYLGPNTSADIAEAGTTSEMLSKLKKLIRIETNEDEANDQLDKLLSDFSLETPHDRYAALVALKSMAKGDAELEHIHLLLNIRLSKTVGEDASSIRAGFNVNKAAQSLEHLGKPSEVIETYVNVVVKGIGIGEIYRHISEKYGLDNADDYLRFLIGAAGDDMNSLGPSSSRVRFHSAFSSISKLQILLSMQDQCSDAQCKLTVWLKPDSKKNDMFESVLNLVENQWPLVSNVHEQSAAIVVDKAQAHVAFLNQLSLVTDRIPSNVYEDDRARENLREVVRDARDEAVLVEESEIE